MFHRWDQSWGGTCSTHWTLPRREAIKWLIPVHECYVIPFRARHTIIASYVFFSEPRCITSLPAGNICVGTSHNKDGSELLAWNSFDIGVLFSSLGNTFLWWAIRTCEGGVSFFSVFSVLTRDFRDLPNVVGANICKFSIFKGRVLYFSVFLSPNHVSCRCPSRLRFARRSRHSWWPVSWQHVKASWHTFHWGGKIANTSCQPKWNCTPSFEQDLRVWPTHWSQWPKPRYFQAKILAHVPVLRAR